MNKVFVINGLPGSGKTFFGQLVGQRLGPQGIDFLHTSSIDPVKRVLMPESEWNFGKGMQNYISQLSELKRNVIGERDWDGLTKDEYWRKAMSDLKAEITEAEPTLLHRWVLTQGDELRSPNVVFVDIREPENIDWFKEFCVDERPEISVKSLLLRSDMSRPFNNSSDNDSILRYDYDIVVENNRLRYEGDERRQLAELQRETDIFINRNIMNGKRTLKSL